MIKYNVLYKKVYQGGASMQRCEITGTGLISGNQISHSHRLTRRVWKPNLQVTTLVVNGSPIKVKVCARTLKTLKGASDTVRNITISSGENSVMP